MQAENALPALMMLVWIPAILLSLAQLVCLVLVIVEMFKRGRRRSASFAPCSRCARGSAP